MPGGTGASWCNQEYLESEGNSSDDLSLSQIVAVMFSAPHGSQLVRL